MSVRESQRNKAGIWARRLASWAVIGLLSLLAAEVAVRLGIAAGVAALRQPQRYASDFQGDLYWRLQHRWAPKTPVHERTGFVHHPHFGWIADRPFQRHPNKTPVLIFGDSFAQGVPPVPFRDRLPRALDLRLPKHQIVDRAVSGYGLDQIYLRFRDGHADFDRPQVFFCIMTLDIDRTIQQVRGAPKPYFELENGELVLRGVPLPEEVDVWHDANPPRVGSYVWALIRQQKRDWQARRGPITEVQVAGERKRALARHLLEATVEEARAHDLPLTFVLLYPPWELGYEGWRERFLKTTLAELGATVIDTKPALRAAVDAHPEGIAGLFLPPPNNHPNAEGYRVIVDQLLPAVLPHRGTAR